MGGKYLTAAKGMKNKKSDQNRSRRNTNFL